MNKTELVKAVAEKSGLSQKQCTSIVDAVFGTVSETLSKGEEFSVIGFGTFKVKQRAEKKGKNPSTGAEITIPAKKAVVFSAGKALKEQVQ